MTHTCKASRLAMTSIVLLASLGSQYAHADCSAVLGAMQKARQQQRVATYEVDDEKSPPVPGEGTVIRIGKERWTTTDGRTFQRKEVPAHEFNGYDVFVDLDRKGQLGCENLGAASYRGAAVTRYRLNNPIMTRNLPPELLKRYGVTNEQLRKMVVLVDKASGLPVYSESFAPTGIKMAFATLYGDAVKEPASTR